MLKRKARKIGMISVSVVALMMAGVIGVSANTVSFNAIVNPKNLSYSQVATGGAKDSFHGRAFVKLLTNFNNDGPLSTYIQLDGSQVTPTTTVTLPSNTPLTYYHKSGDYYGLKLMGRNIGYGYNNSNATGSVTFGNANDPT